MTRASTLAGLTEAIAGHGGIKYGNGGRTFCDGCGLLIFAPNDSFEIAVYPGRNVAESVHAAHVAAVALAWLEGHGWGDGLAARVVLVDYEAELLELKGPCSFATCRLHYAHRGPCCTAPVETGDQK